MPVPKRLKLKWCKMSGIIIEMLYNHVKSKAARTKAKTLHYKLHCVDVVPVVAAVESF